MAKVLTGIEFNEKLQAIVDHCKQRLPGEWPVSLDDRFIELMNDVAPYFPHEIPSTEKLLKGKGRNVKFIRPITK